MVKIILDDEHKTLQVYNRGKCIFKTKKLTKNNDKISLIEQDKKKLKENVKNLKSHRQVLIEYKVQKEINKYNSQ